jgi:hypothetical protein
MATQTKNQPRGKRLFGERRRAPRRQVNADAELLICPSSSRTAPLDVKLKDISATGGGVTYSEPLPLGQKCVIKASALSAEQSRLYTVVRAHPDGEGSFHIGMHASQLLERSGVPPIGGHHYGAMVTTVLLLLAGAAGGYWYFMM